MRPRRILTGIIRSSRNILSRNGIRSQTCLFPAIRRDRQHIRKCHVVGEKLRLDVNLNVDPQP